MSTTSIDTETGDEILTEAGDVLTLDYPIPPVEPPVPPPTGNLLPVLSQRALEELRRRIGLDPDDGSMDTELYLAWVTAYSLVEQYTDRYLVPGQYVEYRTHINAAHISLKGYPVLTIDRLVNVEDESTVGLDSYHVDFVNGLLMLDSRIIKHQIAIQYTIGDPVGGALFLAISRTFDRVWQELSTTADSLTDYGPVKAISSDGSRVEFDVGSPSGTTLGVDIETGLPVTVIGVLQPYMRKNC